MVVGYGVLSQSPRQRRTSSYVSNLRSPQKASVSIASTAAHFFLRSCDLCCCGSRRTRVSIASTAAHFFLRIKKHVFEFLDTYESLNRLDSGALLPTLNQVGIANDLLKSQSPRQRRTSSYTTNSNQSSWRTAKVSIASTAAHFFLRTSGTSRSYGGYRVSIASTAAHFFLLDSPLPFPFSSLSRLNRLDSGALLPTLRTFSVSGRRFGVSIASTAAHFFLLGIQTDATSGNNMSQSPRQRRTSSY